MLAALAAAALLASPGVVHLKAREEGRFEPNYDGGDDYVYYDPDLASLDSLPFDHNNNMTCTNDPHATPFLKQIRGVNIGGWLVLEPWITPSLFYQFLGATEKWGADAAKHIGMDLYSFCEALGPEEGNRQLRRHWKTWLTEADIKQLYTLNIDSLRVPVGDWMWKPYGPYVNCTDGAVDELDRLLKLAGRYGMKVLLDIHGVIGSQNGLDNSGQSRDIEWTSVLAKPPHPVSTFSHWSIRKAEWIGRFDLETLTYSELYWDHLDHVLDAIRIITDMYRDNGAVMGLQPVNEPWQFTPLGPLKRFYWEGYKVVKRRAPAWKFFMHDSFRLYTGLWHGFMKGCPDIMMDTHVYQAWNGPASAASFYMGACAHKHVIADYEEQVMPLVVGEWSLATDNCAMWLNGFNDNLPGYPLVQCDLVDCPEPYMGPEQPGAPPDKNRGPQGPFGTGQSTPAFGKCPVDKSWPDDNEVMSKLGRKKLNAFSYGHGWFFWNFKTELEPKWDYIRAAARGWLPRDALAPSMEVETACEAEDNGDFVCAVRPGATRQEVLGGVTWACAHGAVEIPACDGTAAERVARAADIFNTYWHKARSAGATCDFAGAAELVDPHKLNGTDAGVPGVDFTPQLFRLRAAWGRGPGAGARRAGGGAHAPTWPLLVSVAAIVLGLGGALLALLRQRVRALGYGAAPPVPRAHTGWRRAFARSGAVLSAHEARSSGARSSGASDAALRESLTGSVGPVE